jgi:hypothetical protein
MANVTIPNAAGIHSMERFKQSWNLTAAKSVRPSDEQALPLRSRCEFRR